MSPKKYIIQEMSLTLEHIRESTTKFDNKYSIRFDDDLSTFTIRIKDRLTKELKQSIHSKFNKLMIYKGIVFQYVFVYEEEKRVETKES